MSEPTKCRWVASDQPRAVIGEHYDECADDRCRGCWPCLHAHCLICRREHTTTGHPQTCASCVGAVRDDLEQIVDLFARLEGEAIARGMAGDGEDTVLGGDAMVMLAMRYGDQTGARADDKSHESKEDPTPPLLTLATWEDCYRDHLGHAPGEQATVTSAADYLSRQLTAIAQDAEVPFDDLARDLRQCRGRLEDVLHDGEQIERGAPCPACREADETAKPLLQVRNERDVTGASDRWVCTRNRQHWWTEAHYRLRVADDYRANADKLTAKDIAAEYEIPHGTIRRWASKTTRRIDGETVEIPPKLKPVGRSEDGRRLYRVEDVLALKDRESGEGEVA